MKNETVVEERSRIFGHEWGEIERMQRGGSSSVSRVNTKHPGDYGSDPLGDGTFRMVPSGDVVDLQERNRRLAR